jgi:glycosyltransferase involved in cell wall biosynthesis
LTSDINATAEPSARLPLSAVIITRNAASQIDECLASVAFADEIIVVDSGSDDRTREIATLRGARVVHKEWLGFGRQKQFAVDQAAHDWVLCVDADERVSPKLAESIRRALASPDSAVYRMARCNRFLGRWLRHGEGYPDWSPRLFDRNRARWSDDAVHEKVLYAVTPGTLDGDLLHDSAEDLATYLGKQNRYTTLAARQLYDAGRTAGALKLVFSPAFRFFKFYVLRLGFLDGIPGLVHITIGCVNSLHKYAKLIELYRAEKSK